MEIAEDGLEAHDFFAVEHNVHPKDAVGGGVMRAHGELKKLLFVSGFD